MNYRKHYDLLITKSKEKDRLGLYVEKHHIIPKCLGGSNDKSNIVILTPEEHYVAHQLLVKIYPEVKGIILAAMMMTSKNKNDDGSNNKLYGWLKKKFSENQTGDKNHRFGKPGPMLGMIGEKHHQFGKRGTNCFLYGRKLSEETKMKISLGCKGRKCSEETRLKMSETIRSNPMFGKSGENHPLFGKSGELSPNYGKKRSEESKNKMSESQKGRIHSEESRKKMSESAKLRRKLDRERSQ